MVWKVSTILVVSHDRYFLDRIVNRVVEVRDRQLVTYEGNFSEYWQARQSARPQVVGRVSRRGSQRQSERVQRASQREELANLERQLAEAFANHKIRDGRRLERQLQRTSSQLEDLYDKWSSQG